MIRKFCFLFAFTVCIASSGVIQAAIIMTPPGLIAGDKFRITFVTSTSRDATSTFVADYDAFVTTAANSAGMTYNGNPVTWQAIVSTATVNANDPGRLPTSSTAGIFRIDGQKVATLGSDFWDGSLMNPINLTESGGFAAEDVWTGTNPDGLKALNPLGGTDVQTGYSDSLSSTWVLNAENANTALIQFYGVSSELTVVSIPEPASFLLCGTIVLTGSLVRFRRRDQSA